MRLRIKPSIKASQLLLLHGVPRSLIREFALDITKAVAPLEIGQKVVTNRQQAKWFNDIYDNQPLDPAVYVCSSQGFFLDARHAGLVLFWRYLAEAMNYPEDFNDSVPLWHVPTSEFHDRLLQEYHAGQHQEPNLLVLDNIYTDMPKAKQDKVHDILQIFCDRPRLLLIQGGDAYKYCRNSLGVRPNRIIHFERQLHRQLV